MRMIPESTMAFSTAGTRSRNRTASSRRAEAHHRARRRPRLYQLRSKMTTSPAAGKCGMYRWMYICDRSRSVGAGRATTRNTRGLTRSVIALDRASLAGRVPPLEDDAHLGAGTLDPLLHGHELAVQAAQLPLVLLLLQLRARALVPGMRAVRGGVARPLEGDHPGAVLVRPLLLRHGVSSGLVAGVTCPRHAGGPAAAGCRERCADRWRTPSGRRPPRPRPSGRSGSGSMVRVSS